MVGKSKVEDENGRRKMFLIKYSLFILLIYLMGTFSAVCFLRLDLKACSDLFFITPVI